LATRRSQEHCQRRGQYVVGNTPLTPHGVAITLDDDFTFADSRRAKASCVQVFDVTEVHDVVRHQFVIRSYVNILPMDNSSFGGYQLLFQIRNETRIGASVIAHPDPDALISLDDWIATYMCCARNMSVDTMGITDA
jgi:hypothetical protein